MAGASLAKGQAGPSPNNRKRKATAPSAAAALDDEGEGAEEDIAELERELADLDRRVLEHRRVTAKRVLDAAAAHLAALPPPASLDVSSISETSDSENDKLEKVKIIKSKYKANIAALPKILDKVNETIVECERLENLNVNIHPVFQRKG